MDTQHTITLSILHFVNHKVFKKLSSYEILLAIIQVKQKIWYQIVQLF